MIISLDKFKRNVGPSEPGSGGTGIDFSVIGYGKKDSVNATSIVIEPVEYSKSLYEKWDPATTDAASYFWKDDNLVYAPAVDTSNVTSFYAMFDKCHNLKYAPQYNFANATDTSYMFRDCAELTEVGEIDLTNIEFANSMFNGCQNLKEINFVGSSSKLQTATIISMFENCPAIINVEDNGENANIINIAQSAGKTINKILPMTMASFSCFVNNEYQTIVVSPDYYYALYNDAKYPLYYNGNGIYKVKLPDKNATAEVIWGGTSLGIIETGKDNGALFLGQEPPIPRFMSNDWDNILWQGQSVNVSVSENGLTVLNASNGQQSQFYITIPVPNNDNPSFTVSSIFPVSERDRYTEFYARIYKIRYGSEMYVYNEGWSAGSGVGIISIPFDSSDITYYDDGSAHLEFIVMIIQANREFTISEFMVEDSNAPDIISIDDNWLSDDTFIFGTQDGWQTKEPVDVVYSYDDGRSTTISTRLTTSTNESEECHTVPMHCINLPFWQNQVAIRNVPSYINYGNLYMSNEYIRMYIDNSLYTKDYVYTPVNADNTFMSHLAYADNGNIVLSPNGYYCVVLPSNINIVQSENVYGAAKILSLEGLKYIVGSSILTSHIVTFINDTDSEAAVRLNVKELPYLTGYQSYDTSIRASYELFGSDGNTLNQEVASQLVFKTYDRLAEDYVDFNYEIDADGKLVIPMPRALLTNLYNGLFDSQFEIYQDVNGSIYWVGYGNDTGIHVDDSYLTKQ